MRISWKVTLKPPAERVQRASQNANDRADLVSDDSKGIIDGDGPICQAGEPNPAEDAEETQVPLRLESNAMPALHMCMCIHACDV